MKYLLFVIWLLLLLPLACSYQPELKKGHIFYCKSGDTKQWVRHDSYGKPVISRNSLTYIANSGRHEVILLNIPCKLIWSRQ